MPGAIDYFSQAMNLVFVSIGGATYTASWEEALQTNATAENFAEKVADIATMYNVGVEIDYEESASPLLPQLEAFIRKYRDIHPFEPWDQNPSPPSFLTLDFGQGAQFMGPIANWVAHNAFKPLSGERLLSWANAMVSGGQESRVSDLIARWGQHIYGYSTLQTFPIPPSYLVGGRWSSGRRAQESCIGPGSPTLTDSSLVEFVNNVKPCIEMCGECKAALPAAGDTYSDGMLGYAYWMVGNISPRQSNTCPTDVSIQVYDSVYQGSGDCTDGFTTAATTYGIENNVDWQRRKN